MLISIEIWDINKNIWQTEIRIYSIIKSLDSFDLYDIPNKRRNAKIIKLC